MTRLDWDLCPADRAVIKQIARRYKALAARHDERVNAFEIEMDVACVHLNVVALRLDDLLKADDFNFWHDVGGIHALLDRETGTLAARFRPRFTVRQTAGETA